MAVSGSSIGSLLGTGASFATGIPGLGAIGGSLGGLLGGGSSNKKAANALIDANLNARNLALQQNAYDRAQLQPYLQAGKGATYSLATLLGINAGQEGGKTKEDLAFDLAQKYLPATAALTDRTGTSGQGQMWYDTASKTRYRLDPATGQIFSKPQKGGSWKALNTGQDLLAEVEAAYQAQEAGRAANPDYGRLTRNFSEEDFQTDPGYEFRLAEGEKAINRAQSARGNYLSGGAAKALQRYGQDFASNEYQNAYGRFTEQNNNLYNRLFGVSNQGMNAVNQSANQGQNYVNNLTSTYGNIGNAQAAGLVQGQNQQNQSMAGLLGAVSQYGGGIQQYGADQGWWGGQGSGGINWNSGRRY